MMLKSPNNDKISFQWEISNASYLFRAYLLSHIYFHCIILISGPVVVFSLFFFVPYLTSLGFATLIVLVFYFFFYLMFCGYMAAISLFIFLSVIHLKAQKFYITDKGIYLLQEGMLETARTFFRIPSYAGYLPGMPGGKLTGAVVGKVTDEIIEKAIPSDNKLYNYTAWNNIKEVKSYPKSGIIWLREFRTNINTTVGYLVADRNTFPKVMELVEKYAVRAIFKK